MKLGAYISMKDKLSGSYLESFDFIEHYGELHLVTDEIMAEKMMDLMDLMLEAQENETPVEKVVGNDLECFCKNYFSDVSVFDIIKEAANRLRTFSWFIFIFEVLWIISEIGEEEFSFFSYKTDISGYLFGFAFGISGVILADIVGIILAKFRMYSRKIWNYIVIIVTVAAFVLTVIFIFNSENIEILGYPLLLISGGYLLIYYITIFWCRYKTTGSLKKVKNEYESTFTGLLKEEIANNVQGQDISVVKPFAKRYNKKNAKLVKKGRKKLTTEEFFISQNKSGRAAGIVGALMGFSIPIVIELINAVAGSDSMFETPKDFVFYIITSAIGIYLVMKFFKKVEEISITEQRAILEACLREGIELDAYYEILISGDNSAPKK